jgi:hypothetical protein
MGDLQALKHRPPADLLLARSEEKASGCVGRIDLRRHNPDVQAFSLSQIAQFVGKTRAHVACPISRFAETGTAWRSYTNGEGDVMQNRITATTEMRGRDGGNEEPQPVGEILEELLAQYERRFPDVQITIVEATATAV